MADVLVLSGSVSCPSRTTALAVHVGRLLACDGHHVALVKVRDLPAEAVFHGRREDPAILDLLDRVARADGVVVASPVYKAAIGGVLKTVLDLLPADALAGKVVLPLLTGGSLAHVLALEHSLRPVLAALGADHLLPGRFVLDTDIELAEERVDLLREPARALHRTVEAFSGAARLRDLVATH